MVTAEGLLWFSNLPAARSQLLFSTCDLHTCGNRNPGIIQPQGALMPPELLLAHVPLVLLGQSAVGALLWENGETEAGSLLHGLLGWVRGSLRPWHVPASEFGYGRDCHIPVDVTRGGVVKSWIPHQQAGDPLIEKQPPGSPQSSKSYPLPTTLMFIRRLGKDNPGSSVGHGPAVMHGKGKEGIWGGTNGPTWKHSSLLCLMGISWLLEQSTKCWMSPCFPGHPKLSSETILQAWVLLLNTILKPIFLSFKSQAEEEL